MCTVGFSLKGFVRERGLYFCSIATLRMAMQRFLASCIIVALVTNSVTAVQKICDFEDGKTCWSVPGLSQSYKWQVSTHFLSAQPQTDHTNGNGRYLYANGAPPAAHNDKARLLSGNLEPVSSCLTFWYHMSGANIGTLRVLTRNVIGGQEEELWKKTGDQGSGWREARVSVENFGLFEVVIEATKGTDYHGSNIALDDIEYKTEKCKTSKLFGRCRMEVKGVGCFKDDYRDRVFNQLLATYRGRAMRTDQTIWRTYKASLTRLLCRCASLAKARGYKYFGLQYYAECWSAPGSIVYDRKGKAQNCINSTFELGSCGGANDGACVGAALVNYVYALE